MARANLTERSGKRVHVIWGKSCGYRYTKSQGGLTKLCRQRRVVPLSPRMDTNTRLYWAIGFLGEEIVFGFSCRKCIETSEHYGTA